MGWPFQFARKNDLLNLCCGIRIKDHFPLKNPVVYVFKSPFKQLVDEFAIENKDMLSARSFKFGDEPIEKSLKKIKKQRTSY